MQPLRAVGEVPSLSLGLVVLVVVINVVRYGIRGGGMSLGSDYTKSFQTKLSMYNSYSSMSPKRYELLPVST